MKKKKITKFTGDITYYMMRVNNIDPILINDIDKMKELLINVAKAMNATIVENGILFHQFNPFGITGLIIIGESSLEVHSFPEIPNGVIQFKFSSCSDKLKISNGIKYIIDLWQLKPENFKIESIII